MPQVVVHQEGNGIAVLYPSPGVAIEDVVASVPEGRPYRVVEQASLPADSRDAWTIDFEDPASEVTIDPDKKESLDKKLAREAVDVWFAEAIREGFETSHGWRLGLGQGDVTLLTGQFVLAKEAAALDMTLPPVVDMAGVPHVLSMEELTELMLAYGGHRARLSALYAAQIAAIDNPE